MFTFFSTIIVTCGYVGKVPWAPGTLGTVVAFIGAWYVYPYLDSIQVLIALALAFFPLCGCIAYYQFQKNSIDPPEVVIDEAYASALLLLFVDHSVSGYVLAFILFRLFDILKIGPAYWLDLYRGKAQALAVMVDDIFAAVYVALIAGVMGYMQYL